MATLHLKWTTSKARDTYGWNRLTGKAQLTPSTAAKYVTCGGGYDMIGTVIGDFITDQYQAELRQYADTLTREPYGCTTHYKFAESYGMFARPDGSIYIDGACGQESVRRIAESAGLEMHFTYSKRGHLLAVGVFA
jgi:hypothetical protein